MLPVTTALNLNHSMRAISTDGCGETVFRFEAIALSVERYA